MSRYRFVTLLFFLLASASWEGAKAQTMPAVDRLESIVFSSYLGGREFDAVRGIAVDRLGYIYLAGKTYSQNFPVVNAHQSACVLGPRGSCADAFLAKLTPDGQSIVYSTYLGEQLSDEAVDVAVDQDGNAYVTGTMASSGFVAKFDHAGRLQYLRKLEAYPLVTGRAIAVDRQGKAYVTGHTLSARFPILNPLQAAPGSVSCHAIGGGSFPLDAFVARFDALGTLEFSTYLGGTGNDIGLDIAVDRVGNVYVVGETSSPNFPLASPLRSDYQGGSAQPVGTCNGDDGFVAKLNADRPELEYSTYFFRHRRITLDEAGRAILGDKVLTADGTAYSVPVPDSLLAADASGRIYAICSTSYPSSADGNDGDLQRWVDEEGNLFIGGAARPGDIVLLNPIQPVHGGVIDGFLAKIAGCATPITIAPQLEPALRWRREQLNNLKGLLSLQP
jgi:hypothetical protein